MTASAAMMTFGSLFSGIGGFDLGFERAGMKCAWQVEIDPFCQKVLTKHWPDVPKYGDITQIGGNDLETVDLLCGGFPCQDVSVAGQRAGLSGNRSTLWSEFFRIIGEIRPKWVVVENVRGLYSSDAGRFFGAILKDLASIRYDAEWDCLPAAFVGAPQLRHRVFIVAYPESHNGDSTPSPHIFTQGYSDLGDNWRPASEIIWNGLWIDRKDPTTYIRGFPQPIFHRMDHGVPNRMDQLKSLGNAVVPQVAEWIGRRIVEAHGNV